MQAFHQDETDQEFPSLAYSFVSQRECQRLSDESRSSVPACGTMFPIVICPDCYKSVLGRQDPQKRVHPLDVPIPFSGFSWSRCHGCSSNAEHRCGQQPPLTARLCWRSAPIAWWSFYPPP